MSLKMGFLCIMDIRYNQDSSLKPEINLKDQTHPKQRPFKEKYNSC